MSCSAIDAISQHYCLECGTRFSKTVGHHDCPRTFSLDLRTVSNAQELDVVSLSTDASSCSDEDEETIRDFKTQWFQPAKTVNDPTVSSRKTRKPSRAHGAVTEAPIKAKKQEKNLVSSLDWSKVYVAICEKSI